MPELASAPVVFESQLMLDAVIEPASPGAMNKKPEFVGLAIVSV